MEIKGVNKCGSCDIETNKGKHWRTGTWLCDKCYKEWDEKDKKMHGDEAFSVSKSLVKKVKKGKTKKYKKRGVVTKVHESGSQSRLTMFNDKE